MAEFSLVSTAHIRETAERLFGGTAQMSRPGSDKDLERGVVPPEVYAALRSETRRAEVVEGYRLRNAERAWYGRTIGQLVSDAVGGRTRLDVVGVYEPKPEIAGDITIGEKQLIGALSLGKDWPNLGCLARQWSLSGELSVAGQTFTLDPQASAVSLDLSYPLSDGSRVDLKVVHTLYPYADAVQSQSHRVFGDYWWGIPHEPFTDAPAPPSVLMNRALEMLAEARQA